MGAAEGGEAEEEPRLLAAGQVARRRVHLGGCEAHGADAGADLCFRCIAHHRADVVVGALPRVQFVELVLGEIGDLEIVRTLEPAAEGVESAGDQLGEGRLAVAVGAEQRDAVVVVDPEVEAGEHRAVRVIADRDVLHGDDRRRHRLRRLGKREGQESSNRQAR